MTYSRTLPIMPKARGASASAHTRAAMPYPTPVDAETRQASAWLPDEDEKLLRLRASGLNWQPIAAGHFPTKTPNACRKRHERLMERRNVEDWSPERLERLACEYVAMRQAMWEMLAARLGGERWAVLETKCMEKGFKNLQVIARQAQRRGTADSNGSLVERGTADHISDSGIGLGSGSDAEPDTATSSGPPDSAAPWLHLPPVQEPQRLNSEPRRILKASELKLYQPPPPPIRHTRNASTSQIPASAGPSPRNHGGGDRWSPESASGRIGISIQSVLGPIEQRR